MSLHTFTLPPPQRRLNDTLSDVTGTEFQGFLAQFRLIVSALEAVVGGENAMLPQTSAPALLEALRLYGRGLDLLRTLKTICRAHLGMNASDTNAGSARSTVNALGLRLENAALPLFDALERLALTDPEFAGEPELKLWHSVAGREMKNDRFEEPLESFVQETASQVISPIASLYSHLTSTMAVEVRASDGRTRIQGFSTSVAVLKSADDPILRRTTFESMNAWLASHSASFLDVINAMAGFRTAVLKRKKSASFEALLKDERTDIRVYHAMFDALEGMLPAVRDAVTLRQKAFGAGPMKVWNILSPAPNAIYSRQRTIEETLSHLAQAFEALDPAFPLFLKSACEKGWINARGISRKSAGAWSDDLPSAGAVRVLANYLPTLAGQGALAHLLGAAYQMYVMHDAPMPARLYPISMTEVMGNVYETGLFDWLAKDAARRGDASESASLLWQDLRRITNCLLVLPARHRLLKAIISARKEGVLSLSKINELSTEAWVHYFGSSTDGVDRYVWAYKPHFYRTSPLFYDWQYTLGFLLSKALMVQFAENGRSACGATLRETCQESGILSVEAFGRRHLGADLRSRDFWERTIYAALEPVRLCRAAPTRFNESS